MLTKSSLRPIAVGLIFVLTAGACARASEPRSRSASPGPTTTTRPGANLADVDFGLAEDDPQSFGSLLATGLTSLGGEGGLDEGGLAGVGAGYAVNSFLALIGDVEDSSYSVGYNVTGVDVAAAGGLPGELALSIVHTPDRHKMTVSPGADTAFTQIITPSGTTECTRVAAWECEQASTPPRDQVLGAQHFLYVLALISETPGAFDISEYTSTIVGVPVRCTEGRAITDTVGDALSGDIGVCITGEGVPLSVKGPGFALEGVWYKPSADAGEFTPPSAVK